MPIVELARLYHSGLAQGTHDNHKGPAPAPHRPLSLRGARAMTFVRAVVITFEGKGTQVAAGMSF
jgi:hypothetical protein